MINLGTGLPVHVDIIRRSMRFGFLRGIGSEKEPAEAKDIEPQTTPSGFNSAEMR